MKKNGHLFNICKILKIAGKPVNAHYIFAKLYDNEIEIPSMAMLNTILSDRRTYFNKEKSSCCECGRTLAYYSLSDYGRRCLHAVETAHVPLSREEYTEHGIKVSEGG